MSLARDGISPDTLEAVRALRETGRGGMERKLRDLSRLLQEREEQLKGLEALLDQIQALADNEALYAYDVAAGLRSILRERER